MIGSAGGASVLERRCLPPFADACARRGGNTSASRGQQHCTAARCQACPSRSTGVNRKVTAAVTCVARGRHGVVEHGVDARPGNKWQLVVYLRRTNSTVPDTINLHIFSGLDAIACVF